MSHALPSAHANQEGVFLCAWGPMSWPLFGGRYTQDMAALPSWGRPGEVVMPVVTNIWKDIGYAPGPAPRIPHPFGR